MSDVSIALDKGHVEEVEHSIFPRMKVAVTIPVKVDGHTRQGIVVYVSASAFSEAGEASQTMLVKAVAKRLNLKEEVE